MSSEEETLIGQDDTEDPSGTETTETTEVEDKGAETTKPDSEKGDEEGKGDEDKSGAPEEYAEFALPENMPEGMKVDEGFLGSFKELAKKSNLTQEQAQELVTTYAQHQAKAYEAALKAATDQRNAWLEEVKKADDIGGDKFDATCVFVGKAMKEFGSDALKAVMNSSGLGNHPEVVRLFAKVGKALSEDTIPNRNDAPGERSAAEVLYPAQAKNG